MQGCGVLQPVIIMTTIASAAAAAADEDDMSLHTSRAMRHFRWGRERADVAKSTMVMLLLLMQY